MLTSGMAKTTAPFTEAAPLGAGLKPSGDANPVFAPMDGSTKVGTVRFADSETARLAVENARRGSRNGRADRLKSGRLPSTRWVICWRQTGTA